ncbi:hypothetical protein D3C71_2159080 [compost metagenome]
MQGKRRTGQPPLDALGDASGYVLQYIDPYCGRHQIRIGYGFGDTIDVVAV